MHDVWYVWKETVFEPCLEFVLVCFENLLRILTHSFGLLSLSWLNSNLLGVIRSIVLKSEIILPSAKGKSLILFAISAADVSYWIAESRSFNMVFSINFLTSYIFYSTFSCILFRTSGHVSKSIFTLRLNQDLMSQMSSFIDVHPLMSWFPSSGKSYLW